MGPSPPDPTNPTLETAENGVERCPGKSCGHGKDVSQGDMGTPHSSRPRLFAFVSCRKGLRSKDLCSSPGHPPVMPRRPCRSPLPVRPVGDPGTSRCVVNHRDGPPRVGHVSSGHKGGSVIGLPRRRVVGYEGVIPPAF